MDPVESSTDTVSDTQTNESSSPMVPSESSTDSISESQTFSSSAMSPTDVADIVIYDSPMIDEKSTQIEEPSESEGEIVDNATP
jgi:hypothetical protein